MTCSNCKNELETDDNEFCYYCGTELIKKELRKEKNYSRDTKNKICPGCNEQIDINILACNFCGHPSEGTSPPNLSASLGQGRHKASLQEIAGMHGASSSETTSKPNRNSISTEDDAFISIRDKNAKKYTDSSARYPALRIVAGLYRIVAVITGIAAVILIAVGVRFLDRGSEGVLLIIGGILGGLIGVVTTLAAAEGIRVFIDIEENTRNTYHCIRNQINKQ
jgi:hypothetical protein